MYLLSLFIFQIYELETILPKLGNPLFVRSLQVCFIVNSAFIFQSVSSICLNDNNTKVCCLCSLLKYFGAVLIMKSSFISKCLKQSVTSLHIRFNLLFDFGIDSITYYQRKTFDSLVVR